MSEVEAKTEAAAPPSFAEAVAVWLKVGLLSFGGPAAQIALLDHEVVEKRGWVSHRAFSEALNYCMLLPGPEAQQLATFLGLKLHGLKGAIAAGGLFVLPGAFVLFALSWIAAAGGHLPPVMAIFRGLTPMVSALVAHAVWRLGRKTIAGPLPLLLAVGAFVALALLHIDFPWVILAAALVGAVAFRKNLPPPDGTVRSVSFFREVVRIAGLAAVFAVLRAAPVVAVLWAFGRDPFEAVAVFFTKAAFVTFGGAYAVLPYVADQAVNHYGWIGQADMAHGLGLAETTPGPLILVTEFVGFFAGWNAASRGGAGALTPLGAGAVAAALTVWVTFLPCFFYILAGAPLVEQVGRWRVAAGALKAVTAAVVGVIATLGLTLLKLAVYPQGHVDWLGGAAVLLAFAATLRLKAGPIALVLAGAAFGLGRSYFGV